MMPLGRCARKRSPPAQLDTAGSSTRFASTFMASNPDSQQPEQHFPNTEQLFRRVRRESIGRNGKPTFLAFTLPDMSVNREQRSTAEEARKGYDNAIWGVAAFLVADIPARVSLAHHVQTYRLLPRHVPKAGNSAHSETRVWRRVKEVLVLITARKHEEF